MRSLHERLTKLTEEAPEKEVLLACDITGKIIEKLSRTALLKRIEVAAGYLQQTGLRAGDRIALDFDTSVDLLIVSWAAWSTGIVTVPLDVKRDTPELRAYKIKASSAKRLLSQKEFSEAAGTYGEIPWMPDSSHEALILFTSGTTAYPKGASLTLHNLIVNAEDIATWLHITSADRFLVELPLHHINSTTFCLSAMLAGASIALPPKYSNSHFFEQAANSGSTITSVVPSIVFDQLTRTKEFEHAKNRLKLNRIQLGSAPVVTSDACEFMQKFSIRLYQGYGQTETALRVTGVPVDLPEEHYARVVQENSIGTPLPWAHVEILDAEGRTLTEGEQGELAVKGPAIMQGYIGGEPAFKDGYFLTGDIGFWKEIAGRRFFYLVGRSKEIIIKGGINISPVAVENTLKKTSGDIDQAYVIGVDDIRYGEEIAAVIVWKENTDEASALRRLKLSLLLGHELLSAYETPKYLSSVRAETLPMTSTGKVQRIILKKNIGNAMESIYKLMQSAEFSFVVISPRSSLEKASHVLYNHCWQPLGKNERAYRNYLEEYLTVGALNRDGTLAGQISFSCTQKTISCISICSATYKPKPVPKMTPVPSAEFVRQYLLEHHDPVMNFHHKLGAELVEVIPNGRPEDASSLGYTMLLRYPPTKDTSLAGPVSNQLIQAVRILANDINAEVAALSRPGGLASYLHRSI